MANIIDFKTDVDAWYRNQAKDNTWSSVLNSLEKAYTQVNYNAAKAGEASNMLGTQAAQNVSTSLYSAYKANRKTIMGSGFTQGFKTAVSKRLGQSLGLNANLAYQSSLSQSTQNVGQLDISDNSIYQAYQADVEGVASTWEKMFSYFNLDSGNQTDIDYATSTGLMQNGSLTAKGKAYMKYYLNQTQMGDGTDTYLSDKGTMSKYLQDNVEGINPEWVKTVSEMSGVDLSTASFSDKERLEYLGIETKAYNTTDIQTDFKETTTGENPNKYKDVFSFLFSKNEKDTSVRDKLKKFSTGYIVEAGKDKYIYNDKTTLDIMKNANISETDLTFNGMSVSDAARVGLLEDGRTFTVKGITFIIQDGKARAFGDASTIAYQFNAKNAAKQGV